MSAIKTIEIEDDLKGASSNKLTNNELNGSDGDDNLVGSDGKDALHGGVGKDILHAGAGDDTVDGGEGDDNLDGGDGDDLLTGGSGSNTITGGAGTDTAVYTGKRNSVKIDDNKDGTYTVTHDGAKDILTGVEKVSFNDASMSVAYSIELHDKQAEVSRLYKALLERNPDEGGLSSWVNTTAATALGGQGSNIQSIAEQFTKSAEFQSKYGSSVSNADFVNLLYQNILHRGADQGGYDHWLAEINKTNDRGAVVVGFSNSAEYIAETATTVDAFLSTIAINNYILG